jgi:hypothetical protein
MDTTIDLCDSDDSVVLDEAGQSRPKGGGNVREMPKRVPGKKLDETIEIISSDDDDQTGLVLSIFYNF